MNAVAEFVLVRQAVVYKRIRQERGRDEYRYRRWSVPPDAMPGKASKFKAGYATDRLPEHEVIDRAEAERIQHVSVAEFEQRLESLKAGAQ